MRQTTLPRIGTFDAWRDAARGLLADQVPASDVIWTRGAPDVADLFAETHSARPQTGQTVPKGFLSLARQVVWHRDPERFARLYALLVRLTEGTAHFSDRGDPAIARLNAMSKEVGRDKHKMTAFVRFREIGDKGVPRRRFAAWFEPTHFIMEPSARFFADRFGDNRNPQSDHIGQFDRTFGPIKQTVLHQIKPHVGRQKRFRQLRFYDAVRY